MDTADSTNAKGPARRQRVATEDIVVYVFAAIFIVMFWTLFIEIRKGDEANAKWVESAISPWKPTVADPLALVCFKAQLTLSGLRYQQADRATTGISARRNFGFLVGAIISLLGCVVAIRGTRAKIEAGVDSTKVANARIATTSAGAFIIFVGGAIVMATLLGDDHAKVEDFGIGAGCIAMPIESTIPGVISETSASSFLDQLANSNKTKESQ